MMDRSKYASTLGFAGVLAGSLLVAIDAVALAPSLPVIANAFSATSVETYWAGVAYTLGSATFMPLFPSASAALGRRPVVLAALVLFMVGTIVCGTASEIGALLAGRSIQGVGGGGIVAMLYVVIADLWDMRWRPKALSINGLVWMLGVGTGPIIGGGFSADVSWRWIFWIVLPINGISIVLVALFLIIPTTTEQIAASGQEKPAGQSRIHLLSWKQMDYVGAVLLVCSLASFLIAITWGGTQYPWNSWHTLVPLILGIFAIVAWVFYEGFVPVNAIMPLSILADRTVAIAFIATFVTGVVQFGLTFYLPLYYQIVKGYSPLISGVALLPTNLPCAPATAVVGVLISKTGRYRMIIIVGLALLALGCGLLVLLDVDTSVPAWIFLSIPAALGFGTVLPALTVASTAPVKQEHMAIASGLSPYTRSVGQAIGIAVGNSMVQNLVKNNLASSASDQLRENAELIAQNIASTEVLSMFTQNATERHELLQAYVQALHDFWWLLCALSLSCFVLAFFVRDVSLDRDAPAAGHALSEEAIMERGSDSTPPSTRAVSVATGKNESRQWQGPNLDEWTSG